MTTRLPAPQTSSRRVPDLPWSGKRAIGSTWRYLVDGEWRSTVLSTTPFQYTRTFPQVGQVVATSEISRARNRVRVKVA